MFTNNERHGVYLASVLSTVSLIAVVVLLPLVHQHFQRTMSMMLSNVQQCQHQSSNLWHQLISPEAQLSSGTSLRQKRRNNMALEEANKPMDDAHTFKGSCCACTQGPPGLRGPPGRDGFNGKDGKSGTLGYPGRPGKYIPAPPVEQTSCQMCHPGPPGPPGLPGLKGLRGHAGEPGQAVKHEENNHPGPPGPQGARGEPGPPGNNGPIGDMGRLLNGAAPGRPGQMGPYGPRGTPGVPGKDGQPGVEGARGMRGPSGERGDDGPQGPQGPSGMPGLPGDPGGCGHCQKNIAVSAMPNVPRSNPAQMPMPTFASSVSSYATATNPAGSIPVLLTVPHQQQPALAPTALGQQDGNGQAQQQKQQLLSKAHGTPTHFSPKVLQSSAQFGQHGAASAPSIPVPMAPPGQEPSTVMPTVTISGKFVGYGGSNVGGGYGAAVMAAANKNDENVEYVDEVQQNHGQKTLFISEASVGKK